MVFPWAWRSTFGAVGLFFTTFRSHLRKLYACVQLLAFFALGRSYLLYVEGSYYMPNYLSVDTGSRQRYTCRRRQVDDDSRGHAAFLLYDIPSMMPPPLPPPSGPALGTLSSLVTSAKVLNFETIGDGRIDLLTPQCCAKRHVQIFRGYARSKFNA